MRILIYFFISVFLSQNILWALEIDEKLTLRILRTSSSKKTLLINRGLEDGLAEGDHAKFYLTSGIVARGVLVKVAPTRSIWSVYRLIDADKVALDRVLNLKISTPIKLTGDPSRMLSPEQSPDGAQIPMAPGADDLPTHLSEGDKQDLAALSPTGPAMSVTDIPGISKNRTLELWGTIQFSGLTTTSDRGSEGGSSGSNSTLDMSLGFEKYFADSFSMLRNFSFFALFHVSKKDTTTLEGTTVGLTAIDYGVGVNYHFFASPLSYNRFLPYASFSVGVGQSEEVLTVNTTTTTTDPQPFSGASQFYSLGLGLKYYLARGFGFRAFLDYYNRKEVYAVDGLETDFSNTVAGPRMQIGLSYRW